ncbi:hypothetical protein [Halalkalibacterium ligniniphilum]|uniref:hypothetical protein n=1 Tax=Halalkalibacterium ligniniphilum TaxID=1134413 RepID=UPI00035D3AF7|nr:hypothetical protein [Halalkalibacterium ligniniphilum]
MEQPKANDKLYYFGANNFVYASNKSEVRNMFNENIQEKVQLLSKQLSNSVLSRVENNELEGKIKQLKNIKIEDLSLKRSKKNEELWSSILETSDYNNEQEDLVTALNYPSSGRIDGWTHMWQGQSGVNGSGSACGPATAAMILDYMHYRFDSNIRNVNTYGSQSAFINALRYYLGTQSWGTTYPMFAERLQQILNTDSNGWNVVRVNGPGGGGSATYMHDRFKDRIIAQRPPAVYWHTWSVFDDPMIETEYHWQMGFAYWRESGSDMIRVVEPAWQNTHVRNYNFNTQSPYFHLVIIGGAPS